MDEANAPVAAPDHPANDATTIGKEYQAPALNRGKAPTLTILRDASHPSRLLLPIVANR